MNITANVVTAQASHLSLFAVLGETRRVFLPVVLRSYQLVIAPGEPVFEG